MKHSPKFAVILLLSGFWVFGASRVAAQSPTAAAVGGPAEHLTLEGVENFARIGPILYRGAQPKPFAYNELKNIGVSIVVDFREEKSEITAEKHQVEALGMKFVSLPWRASHGPVPEQISSFLALVRGNPDKKIFVHCKRGADRTGLMVALYRMTFDHWTAANAVNEMNVFHYHSFLLPNLARYVLSYSVQTAADSAPNSADSPNRSRH